MRGASVRLALRVNFDLPHWRISGSKITICNPPAQVNRKRFNTALAIYFKLYKSQLPVLERALEMAALMLSRAARRRSLLTLTLAEREDISRGIACGCRFVRSPNSLAAQGGLLALHEKLRKIVAAKLILDWSNRFPDG